MWISPPAGEGLDRAVDHCVGLGKAGSRSCPERRDGQCRLSVVGAVRDDVEFAGEIERHAA